MWKVYKITSELDEHAVYIGQTTYNLSKAIAQLGSSIPFCADYKRNTWIRYNYKHLQVEQIYSTNDRDTANRLKSAQISKHLSEGYRVLNEVYPITNKRINETPKTQTHKLPHLRIYSDKSRYTWKTR